VIDLIDFLGAAEWTATSLSHLHLRRSAVHIRVSWGPDVPATGSRPPLLAFLLWQNGGGTWLRVHPSAVQTPAPARMAGLSKSKVVPTHAVRRPGPSGRSLLRTLGRDRPSWPSPPVSALRTALCFRSRARLGSCTSAWRGSNAGGAFAPGLITSCAPYPLPGASVSPASVPKIGLPSA